MLDACKIPKYQSPLVIPPIFKPSSFDSETNAPHYHIDIVETSAQMLPESFPRTITYGYAGLTYNPYTGEEKYVESTPGPTFSASSFQPIHVTWNNKLEKPHMFAVDPTLHWANPNNISIPPDRHPPFPPGFPRAQFPIPTVTHLHGGETPSEFDGFPDSWFTFNELVGPTYTTNCYTYPNHQQSSNLFYHDHTLGMTRLNVYAGLSGAYIIRDPKNPLDDFTKSPLPQGIYDIPLLIQDKSFNEDGSLYFPSDGINPQLHPYWRPSFFGNTQVVNGVVWPHFHVESRPYRFRLINGANSRIYKFKLSCDLPFIQIGTDSGYLESPVIIGEIILSPAERADIIIDFSKFPIGAKIRLLNVNDDDHTDPKTTGQIMEFVIAKHAYCPPLCLPQKLNHIPTLQENISKRILVLNAATNDDGLVALLLNGQPWSNPISELPIIGSTQVWEFVNISNGPHPIHIHLIDFLVVSRQDFDRDTYSNDWNTINGPSPLSAPTKVIDPDAYLIGHPILPSENERGWKDTVLAYPGQVTRIIVPMFPSIKNPSLASPGKNLFPFDPTEGPGYVWHCHILDHEDNEMMRPMKIIDHC